MNRYQQGLGILPADTAVVFMPSCFGVLTISGSSVNRCAAVLTLSDWLDQSWQHNVSPWTTTCLRPLFWCIVQNLPDYIQQRTMSSVRVRSITSSNASEPGIPTFNLIIIQKHCAGVSQNIFFKKYCYL